MGRRVKKVIKLILLALSFSYALESQAACSFHPLDRAHPGVVSASAVPPVSVLEAADGCCDEKGGESCHCACHVPCTAGSAFVIRTQASFLLIPIPAALAFVNRDPPTDREPPRA